MSGQLFLGQLQTIFVVSVQFEVKYVSDEGNILLFKLGERLHFLVI